MVVLREGKRTPTDTSLVAHPDGLIQTCWRTERQSIGGMQWLATDHDKLAAKANCRRGHDAYVEWRESASASGCVSPLAERGAAGRSIRVPGMWPTYREERASEVYAGVISRLDPLVAHPPGATEDRPPASSELARDR